MIAGLDLLGARPWIATGDDQAEARPAGKHLPSVLLPLHHREQPPAGPDSEQHRRGAGLIWPPEAQVPVLNDSRFGSGRIPVVHCYRRLIDAQGGDGGWGSLTTTAIEWQPEGGAVVSRQSQDLLAAATNAWLGPLRQASCGVVVPDGLLATAQQALIDAHQSSVSLVPATMAHALAWCHQHDQRHLLAQALPKDGKCVGHVLVADLGLLAWRLTRVPVHAVSAGGKEYLVPIQDGFGIRYRGLSIQLPAIAGWDLMRAQRQSAQHDQWVTDLLMGTWPTTWDNAGEVWSEPASPARACGWRTLDEPMGGRSDVRSWLQALSQAVKEPCNAGQCLAVVVAGAAARCHLQQGVMLWQKLGQLCAVEARLADPGDAARAGWLAARGATRNEPTWREVVAPMAIHHLKYDHNNDPVEAWAPLISVSTLDAGTAYRSKAAVEGLKVQAGAPQLSLTLKRDIHDKQEYRHVNAPLVRAPTSAVPVVIGVEARAGQGLARVTIQDAAQSNQVDARLDWSTMAIAGPPAPPRLAYIPHVARLIPLHDLWADGSRWMKDMLSAFGRGEIDDEAIRYRTKSFNRWPHANSYDRNRGLDQRHQLFDYYSSVGSDGAIPAGIHVDDFAALRHAVDTAVSKRRSDDRVSQLLRRLASWWYAGCPPGVLAVTRKSFETGNVTHVDRHAAGLTFSTTADMALFWRVMARTRGLNTHWLRAARSILRLREHAARTDALTDAAAIQRSIMACMSQGLTNEKPLLVGEGIECMLYLLKRRRYENDFLDSKGRDANDLEALIRHLLKNDFLKPRHRLIGEAFLKFVDREGSLEMLGNLVAHDGDDDADD